MKKFSIFFLWALLSLTANAAPVEIDGIWYNLIPKGNAAEVTNKPSGKYSGAVNIPEKITYKGVEYTVSMICDYAFNNCGYLSSVTIGDGVTSIGEKAFYNCYNLNSLKIGNSVKSIDDYAFYYCYSLNSVTIPNSVESIGYSTFSYCSGLTSLTIGNSVTSIGSYAFIGCRSLSSVTIPNSVKSINYRTFYDCSRLTSVSIGNGVTNINSEAFYNCSRLNSVTLGNSVKYIDSYAFYNCSSLTSINIPNSVTSLYSYAFYNCSSLNSVTLGNGVKSIGSYAFYGCSSLASINIPNSVTSLYDYAFYGCSGLKSVNIGDGLRSIGSYAFYYCSSLTSLTIGNSVNSIGSSAFYKCSALSSVTIPHSVTSIGNYAFCYCSGLTSVNLGNSVTSIGSSAFYYCSGLVSITFPNSLKSIASEAFARCGKLTDVYCRAEKVRENPYTSSGLYTATDAFKYSYQEYISLHVPASSIKAYRALEPWSKFKEIVALPEEDVTETVGINGIWYNINYDTMNAEVTESQSSSYSGNINIPSSVSYNGKSYCVKSIGKLAFYRCKNLTSVTIPTTVTYIGSSAFEECTGLTSLTLNEGLETMGGSAFEGCTGLKVLTIPSTISSVLINAFKNCKGITDVYCYAEDVPETDENAFDGTPTEKSTLHVPANAVESYRASWPWSDFKEIVPLKNTSLIDEGIIFAVKDDGTLEVTGIVEGTTTVDILSTVNIDGTEYHVTSIGARAFEGRSNIKYLSIPESITYIGEYAFIDCGSNMTVNIANPEAWCKMELGNEHSSPLSSAGKVLVYDVETDEIDIPEGVTSIGNYTFYQCRCITSLTIPATVSSIGSSAFEDCTGLTTLDINEGLQSIGGSAFEGCVGLTSLSIPSTVNSISINAFRNCKGITDVYCYAENVPETDENTFDSTPTEKSILHVPANVVDVYRSAWPWSDFMEIVPLRNSSLTDNGIIFTVKEDGSLEVTGLETGTTKVDILSTVTIDGIDYQVTSIGKRAFEGRDDIEYLSIPYSVTSIGEFAFIDCGNTMTVNIADPESWCQMELGNEHSSPLSSAGKVLVCDVETDQIDIPEGVTSIGQYTFYQCQCIKSLNIPATVTSIGSSAFEDCTDLTSLTLGEGLESIGGSAFEGCIGLQTLTIPSTVNFISINAFKNCKSITDVYCYAENVPNTDENAFYGTPTEESTLHVPADALDAYKAAWPWSDFKEIVALNGDDPDGIMAVKQIDSINFYYDLNGRKTDQPRKGIYIRNGKKFVVK